MSTFIYCESSNNIKIKKIQNACVMRESRREERYIYKRTWWRPMCLVVGDGVAKGRSSNIGKQQLEVTLVSKGKSTL